jgi:hypothetical protein
MVKCGIYVFSDTFLECFLGSQDQKVTMSNQRFGQNHAKPNFRVEPVLKKISQRKMSKAFLGCVKF